MTTTRGTIARVKAVITDVGKSVAEIAKETGMHQTTARAAVRILSLDREVFTCRRNIEGTKQHFLMVFASEAARDAKRAEFNAVAKEKLRLCRAAYKARMKRAGDPARQARAVARQQAAQAREAAEMARRKEAEQRAKDRLIRAAEREQARLRDRLNREAAEAEKARAKTEAKKQQARLKAETKAAGRLVFRKGTDVVATKKLAWEDIPVNNPNGIEPVKYESNLRDRFAVTEAAPVVSSRECRAWAEAVAA